MPKRPIIANNFFIILNINSPLSHYAGQDHIPQKVMLPEYLNFSD
jgi:hypothetical protein